MSGCLISSRTFICTACGNVARNCGRSFRRQAWGRVSAAFRIKHAAIDSAQLCSIERAIVRGEIDPYTAGTVAIGVFVGASVGSRVAHRIELRFLNLLFVAVLLWTALQMLLRAVG